MITISLEKSAFNRDMKRFQQKSDLDFKKAIRRATLEMEQHAKIAVRDFTRNSKVKSGFLIKNIHKRITDMGLTGEVTSGAGYSQAVEEGTRPHPIAVVNKKVLAGPYRGRPPGWEVSKKSKEMGYATYGKYLPHGHPGTHPQPFMFPAFKWACAQLEKLIKQTLS
jgi:hypothetical protein